MNSYKKLLKNVFERSKSHQMFKPIFLKGSSFSQTPCNHEVPISFCDPADCLVDWHVHGPSTQPNSCSNHHYLHHFFSLLRPRVFSHSRVWPTANSYKSCLASPPTTVVAYRQLLPCAGTSRSLERDGQYGSLLSSNASSLTSLTSTPPSQPHLWATPRSANTQSHP